MFLYNYMIFLVMANIVFLAIVCVSSFFHNSIKPNLNQRVGRAHWALACDDEANAHYAVQADAWFRAKLAVKAFVLNR